MDISALQDTFVTTTGFRLKVQTLPPYYLDFIDDVYPLKQLPKRRLTTVTGDTFEYDYQLPESTPDPDTNVEEFELYLKYRQTVQDNQEIQARKDRVRRDFLLANCVTILDGPIDFNSTDWEYDLEAALEDYEVPEHPGQRKLAFLKGIVIRNEFDGQMIFTKAISPEVTMQGITNALRGFRPDLGGETSDRSDGRKKRKKHSSRK